VKCSNGNEYNDNASTNLYHGWSLPHDQTSYIESQKKPQRDNL
jgi:hypothetical protein